MPDQITVTMGEETFSPYKYHTFRVGPFTYTTHAHADETIEDAFKRANRFLKEHATKMFRVQKNLYFEHLEEVERGKPQR